MEKSDEADDCVLYCIVLYCIVLYRFLLTLIEGLRFNLPFKKLNEADDCVCYSAG